MKLLTLAHKGRSLSIAFLGLTSVFCCVEGKGQNQVAQTPTKNSVTLKSWKRGNAKVAERTIALSFAEDVKEYEFDVYEQTNTRQFRLQFRRFHLPTVRRPSIHCWWLNLKEVTKDKKFGGNILGPNLLSVEGPGVGDTFGGEDFAMFLCPVKNPQGALDGFLYPISAERNFIVEGFWLTVRVTDFEYDEQAIKLKKINLKIQFKNSI